MLEDGAALLYMISVPYWVTAARGIRWDDPALRVSLAGVSLRNHFRARQSAAAPLRDRVQLPVEPCTFSSQVISVMSGRASVEALKAAGHRVTGADIGYFVNASI